MSAVAENFNARELADAPAFDPWQWIDRNGSARAVFYKNGARVYFEGAGNAGKRGRIKGAKIRDQSDTSRRLCALMLGNANCDWVAMTTLTWRFPPTAEKVRLAVDRLRRKWKERWGESACAWIMEMQARGVPHFHIFHAAQSAFGKACLDAEGEHFPSHVGRGGKVKHARDVVRGTVDRWLVGAWLDCTEQLGDADALAFNRGGICELMRSPDAAGRYVAKEVGKREQKALPARYADGLGRWWWLAPRWEPKPISVSDIDLRFWPFDVPLSHIWEGEQIAGAVSDGELVKTGMPLRHFLRVMGLEAWPSLPKVAEIGEPEIEISAAAPRAEQELLPF